jgi:Trypsin
VVKNMKTSILLGSALLAAIVSSACSQAANTEGSLAGEAQANVEEVAQHEDALLGGHVVTDPKLAAVGALVYYLPEIGVLDVFCSATLIGPNAVLTARHCTPSIDFAAEAEVQAAIAFGEDAFAPTLVVPITGYVTAPAGPGVNNGLLLDGGRDVAVAYLESTPAGITPAKLGRFDNDMLGKKFKVAGYGVYESNYIYGQKHAGGVTARAIKGQWYKLLFNGDYDAYLEWYFTDSPSAIPSETEALDWWKIYKLENKYELLAGGLPGEALGCFGDSGGPIFTGTKPCDLTVYGVSFATEGSTSNVCMGGGAYLVFNKEMLKFVKDAL